MDSLERLVLAEKIVLDRKLFQYVLFRGSDERVRLVAERFENTEYIVENLEVELTEDYLECLFEEVPTLTRVYLLCNEQELPRMQQLVQSYKNSNPLSASGRLRTVCVVAPSANLQALRSKHPWVAFLNDTTLSYQEVIRQVHSMDKQVDLRIRPDVLYLHQKHKDLAEAIEQAFPRRFSFVFYKAVAETAKTIFRPNEGTWNQYLVLHESVAGEKVGLDNYTKIFMMGRAKTIPSKVVRVLRKEELIELLKK
jgi:hypothetical protein